MLYFFFCLLLRSPTFTHNHTHTPENRGLTVLSVWTGGCADTHFHSHTPQSSLSISASGVSLLYFPAARSDWPTKTILLTDWSSVRGFFSPHALRSGPTPFLSYSSSYAYYISQYVGSVPNRMITVCPKTAPLLKRTIQIH